MERRTIKKLLKYGTIGLLLLIIVGYASFQAKNLVEGPSITIVSPANGESFEQSLITIEGKAHNAVDIRINDRPIFIDEQGFFSEKELLSPGFNAIKVSAADKFGRNTLQILEFLYQ